MKIKEYNQMMSYLTRPGTPYQGQKDMETQVKKSVENNKNPGTFKKLVKEDEAAYRKKNVQGYLPGLEPEKINKPGPSIQQQVINYSPKKIVDVEKTLEKYEDDYVSKRGEQTIALTNTANKLKGAANKNDYILKEDRNGLMVNKNRTIAVRDSFVAKQFNNALGVEPEASPEQFGKLAERLEKDRQMRGEPTNVQRFEKNFKNINSKKPIKKIKKISKPLEPFKISAVLPIPTYTPEPIDPRAAIMEARFKELVRKNEEEKIRINNSGLAGLIGKKIYD